LQAWDLGLESGDFFRIRGRGKPEHLRRGLRIEISHRVGRRLITMVREMDSGGIDDIAVPVLHGLAKDKSRFVDPVSPVPVGLFVVRPPAVIACYVDDIAREPLNNAELQVAYLRF